MYEMLAFIFEFIVGVPVTTDGENRLGRLVHGHNVRDGDFSFCLIFRKLIVRQHQFYVHF